MAFERTEESLKNLSNTIEEFKESGESLDKDVADEMIRKLGVMEDLLIKTKDLLESDKSDEDVKHEANKLIESANNKFSIEDIEAPYNNKNYIW